MTDTDKHHDPPERTRSTPPRKRFSANIPDPLGKRLGDYSEVKGVSKNLALTILLDAALTAWEREGKGG